MEELNHYSEQAISLALEYAPKLALALITLIVGLWVAKRITNVFKKILVKRNVDESLIPFLTSMTGIILKVIIVISVIDIVGVETTSFVAILGAAGLAIGMALSGTLQNFAGGVMILVFKPYKVGDFIEAQGYMGVVHEIQIFVTIIKTVDNKRVIIPNAPLSTGSLINYSAEEERRVDFTFGIGYGDDIDKAKDIMMKLIEAEPKILKTPEPFLAVSELADSSVNFTMRVWVKSQDYWDVYFPMIENVKKTFDKEGISIPFPQMDVHTYKN